MGAPPYPAPSRSIPPSRKSEHLLGLGVVTAGALPMLLLILARSLVFRRHTVATRIMGVSYALPLIPWVCSSLGFTPRGQSRK